MTAQPKDAPSAEPTPSAVSTLARENDALVARLIRYEAEIRRLRSELGGEWIEGSAIESEVSQAAHVLMALPRIIREGRVAAGLTQSDLARLAGVVPSQVSRIESGKRIPQTAIAWGLLDLISTRLRPEDTEGDR